MFKISQIFQMVIVIVFATATWSQSLQGKNKNTVVKASPKKFHVSIQSFGLFPFVNQGGTIGYSLSGDSIVELSIAESASPFGPVRTNSKQIKWKNFWGAGSFYTDILFGTHEFEWNENFYLGGDFDYHFSPYSSESYIAGFGIGNRWTYDSGFHIGVDWFSISFALGYKRKWGWSNLPKEFNEISLEDKKRIENSYSEPMGRTTILTPYMGWSF